MLRGPPGAARQAASQLLRCALALQVTRPLPTAPRAAMAVNELPAIVHEPGHGLAGTGVPCTLTVRSFGERISFTASL